MPSSGPDGVRSRRAGSLGAVATAWGCRRCLLGLGSVAWRRVARCSADNAAQTQKGEEGELDWGVHLD